MEDKKWDLLVKIGIISENNNYLDDLLNNFERKSENRYIDSIGIDTIRYYHTIRDKVIVFYLWAISEKKIPKLAFSKMNGSIILFGINSHQNLINAIDLVTKYLQDKILETPTVLYGIVEKERAETCVPLDEIEHQVDKVKGRYQHVNIKYFEGNISKGDNLSDLLNFFGNFYLQLD